jgi:signal-transduction protein with cAMP-binding, CBS, and nucleotidyltransferase domain
MGKLRVISFCIAMKTASDILLHKPPAFNLIAPDAQVKDAVKQMCVLNRSYLLVMDDENDFKGIFCEHDLVHNALLLGAEVEDRQVKEVMQVNLQAVAPDTPVEEVVALMYAHHHRYVPVFSGWHFEGVITTYDILNVMLECRERFFSKTHSADSSTMLHLSE